MRRLVAALVVALITLVLAGCGGGGTAAAPPATPAPAAPAAAAPASPPAAQPVSAPGSGGEPVANVTTSSATNKLSPQEPGVNAPFPSSGKHIPDVIRKNLADGQPMLVFFFDPEQSATGDQRAQIDAAVAEYRGLVDLVEFDVTGALPDPVTNEAPKEELPNQIALLVQDLQIGYTPYVILVDKRGIMTARYRGFVDQALLMREIIRATQ